MADAVVIYDRDCGFCQWALAKVLLWDRRRALRPLPLQDPEAPALLPGMDEERRMASWHLVAGGEVRSGGAAIAPLLRMLPGGGPPASVAERMPGAADRGYRFVAGRRGIFGRPVTSGMRERADRRIASRSLPPASA